MKNKYTNTKTFDLPLTRGGENIGRLHFCNSQLVPHLVRQKAGVHFSSAGMPLDTVRNYITHRYHKAFDACISVTFPELVWITDEQQRIIAATGIRSARNHPLFLEQYTDSPIESLLPAERSQIVEIGNLVSSNRSATIALFCCVALILERRGIRFATATGTQFLEHRLRSLGMSLTRLCSAGNHQLDHTDQHWGQYYETRPHVLAGSISTCAQHLRNRLQVSLNPWPQHTTVSPSARQAVR